MNKLTSLLALLCIPFCMTYAQSDEINISAAFSSSIDLRIASGANINMAFSTLEDYQNGKSGECIFEVASSVNFNVAASMTPFTNADGDEIALKNLTYRLKIASSRSSEEGVKWNFGTSNSSFGGFDSGEFLFSDIYYATTDPLVILTPGSQGNAGNYEDNQFGLFFRLGHPGYNNGAGLSTLLDQNIAPGTYTCTVTLEAIPEAL